MNTRKIFGIAALLLVFCLFSGVVLAQVTLTVSRWIMGGSGGTSTGNNISLSTTLGQGIGGLGNGNNVTIYTGLWHGPEYSIYLPVVMRKYFTCDSYEPNDNRFLNPWGPLQSGQPYQAKLCTGDTEDNYYFEAGSTGQAQLRLQLPSSLIGHTAIWLYEQSDLSQPICGKAPVVQTDYAFSCSLPALARYVLRLYTDGTSDNAHSYTIWVTHP